MFTFTVTVDVHFQGFDGTLVCSSGFKVTGEGTGEKAHVNSLMLLH